MLTYCTQGATNWIVSWVQADDAGMQLAAERGGRQRLSACLSALAADLQVQRQWLHHHVRWPVHAMHHHMSSCKAHKG